MRQASLLEPAEQMATEVASLGIELSADTNGMRASSIAFGGPAYWSGIKVGDVILRFEDGATCELKALMSTHDIQMGPIGSRVSLWDKNRCN